jgi:pyrimidine-nucleoside phosphorylase
LHKNPYLWYSQAALKSLVRPEAFYVEFSAAVRGGRKVVLPTEIIARKRDGLELSTAELSAFIEGYTRGDIPDYQAAAWLMAVYLRGLSLRETVDLTHVMAHSGDTLDLSDIAPFIVDKHSTGGVGDNTTLVVAPLVASTGLPVGKMSGRGLGFTGGTVDKLESIPGFRCNLSSVEFREILRRHGIVVSGQTPELVPADGKLYALRDVTATVSSLPLIASSIMSKKIACGANGIVLDVKVGQGAFMKTLEEAETLATLMLDIGKNMNRRMAAVISNMEQPLGCAVGNALEVTEAVETLQGHGPTDLLEHCLAVGARMLVLAGRSQNVPEATQFLQQSLVSGQALDTFRHWIIAQGGDGRVADSPREILPCARVIRTVGAPQTGWITSLNALEVGQAVLHLGAGRTVKGAAIDPSVGLVLHRKVGDEAGKGQPLYTIHAASAAKSEEVETVVSAAYTFGSSPTPALQPILRIY